MAKGKYWEEETPVVETFEGNQLTIELHKYIKAKILQIHNIRSWERKDGSSGVSRKVVSIPVDEFSPEEMRSLIEAMQNAASSLISLS